MPHTFRGTKIFWAGPDFGFCARPKMIPRAPHLKCTQSLSLVSGKQAINNAKITECPPVPWGLTRVLTIRQN